MTKHFAPLPRGVVAVRADASDAKALAEQIKANFEAFKAEHTEQLAEVRKGFNDVVKAEKVDKINASITELQSKLDEATKAAKAAKDAEARMDELEKMTQRLRAGGGKGADRDVTAEAEAFFSGKQAVERVEMTDAKAEAYSKYADTFATFLRAGGNPAVMTHDVQAAMQVGSDPEGGYWVPTQMTNDIKKRLFDTSPVRQVASVLTITTDSVAFPTDANDATSGGWVGETDAPSETATQKIGEQKIYVREQFAEPRVTQKLLDMATINVEAWLNGKIAEKLSRTENTAFVNGSGVDQPRGFMNYSSAAVTTDDASRSWGVLQYVVSGASAGFATLSGIPGAADDGPLIDIISKLKPAYRAGAIFAMNRATEAAIRKLRDGDGRLLVQGAQGVEGGFGFSIHGFPIVNMEDMANIGADSFSLAFGNFATGYQIVDGRGIRVLRDPYTAKPYVKFYTTKWTGGDVVNFDAIKLMKFGTS